MRHDVRYLQFLGMSIWTWKDHSVAQGVAQTVVQVVTHPAQEAASWTAVWLPILMMYSPVQVVCTALAISFMFAPAAFAAAFWVGSLAVYYAVTLPGAPEHTGGAFCLLTPALFSLSLTQSLPHSLMHSPAHSLIYSLSCCIQIAHASGHGVHKRFFKQRDTKLPRLLASAAS